MEKNNFWADPATGFASYMLAPDAFRYGDIITSYILPGNPNLYREAINKQFFLKLSVLREHTRYRKLEKDKIAFSEIDITIFEYMIALEGNKRK